MNYKSHKNINNLILKKERKKWHAGQTSWLLLTLVAAKTRHSYVVRASDSQLVERKNIFFHIMKSRLKFIPQDSNLF